MISNTKQLRNVRSLHFIPAVKERFINKVLSLNGNHKPDAIIFDLEDSVHPYHKDDARQSFAKLIKVHEKQLAHYLVGIRINSVRTHWYKKDCQLIKKLKPDFVVLAKIESTKELIDARKRLPVPQFLVPVETLTGVNRMESIIKILTQREVFIVGYEDLSAELMIERPDKLYSLNPLSTLLMQAIILCRSYGVTIFDAVSRKFQPKHLQKFREECEQSRLNGLQAKVSIHPNQISIINHVFDTRHTKTYAANILAKFNELRDKTMVTTNEKSEMIDTPSYRMYTRVLSQHQP